jgi:serine protease Do
LERYLVFGLTLALCVVAEPLGAAGRHENETLPTQPAQTVVIQDQGGFASAISRVAEVVMPTVVHIEITGAAPRQAPTMGFPRQNGLPQSSQPLRALGSGIIVSEDGYIVTNNHVVENAQEIEVQLYGGERRTAKLVGTDPGTDLAVVKIEPPANLSYAVLGDSDALKVGEWVIAVGSPRGLDWTVTAGIVSAKHRRDIGALGPMGFEDFIQTDTAINPGNSGGPLINLKGEVVGINSLILSASQGSEGLGFAIPANMAKGIVQTLIRDGKVVRGDLGLSVQDLTPELARSMKLPEGTTGVIVAAVRQGGPGEQAGISPGDVLFAFGTENIKDASQFRYDVAGAIPGKEVTVTVLRDGKRVELAAHVADLSAAQKELAAHAGEAALGMALERMPADVAKKLGLRRATGLVVSEVLQGSPAAQAGIISGDVIFRIANVELTDPKQFNDLVTAATKENAQAIPLLVLDASTGQAGYLMVPLQ